MFENYTDRAMRAVRLAQENASLLGRPETDVQHLLIGLADEAESTAGEALRQLGITLDELRAQEQKLPSFQSAAVGADAPAQTEDFREVLKGGSRESARLGQNYVSAEGLLLGVAAFCERQPQKGCAEILRGCGLAPQMIREKVHALLSASFAEPLPARHPGHAVPDAAAPPARPAPRPPLAPGAYFTAVVSSPDGKPLGAYCLQSAGQGVETEIAKLREMGVHPDGTWCVTPLWVVQTGTR